MADSPILVFQMAKVASQSWLELLQTHYPDRQISHFHFASADRLDLLQRMRSARGPVQTMKHITQPKLGGPDTDIEQWVGQENWLGPSVTIIAGVRDPMDRALSTIAYMTDRMGYKRFPVTVRDGGTPENLSKLLNMAIQTARADTQSVPDDTLLTMLGHMLKDAHVWFDNELKGYFGLDIADQSFDYDRRLMDISGHHRAIIYRFEDIVSPEAQTRMLKSASELLGASLGSMPRQAFHNKRSAALYKAFQKTFRVTQDDLDWMYNSPAVHQFYSADEIAAFKARWAPHVDG